MPKPLTQNTLFYGDNLPILREHIPDESIDLIYLDPPFNSNRSYNVLFKDERGEEAEAQIAAFDDTWHWNASAERTFHELIQNAPARVAAMLGALREFVGTNQMMAYLTMMAARLVELHRVLKPTGSLYLHCDPTASHYLKIVMDTIFGPGGYRNEITWKRSSAHSDIKQGRKAYGNIVDILLHYTKTEEYTFNPQFADYDEEYIRKTYNNVDPDGRRWKSSDLTGPGGAAKGNPSYEFMGVTRYWRFSKENMERLLAEGRIHQSSPSAVPRMKHYLDEMQGVSLQNIWDDIPPIGAQAKERMGYPTQKPLALLERIIEASSNEGDVVLDPFCGCGTAVAAAHKLNRRWIGIDITHLSISLMKYRLKDMFGLVEKQDYAVLGEPEDLASARQLARSDRYQFQWWALSLVQAKPLGGGGGREGKKGSDKGVDGVLNFLEEKGKLQRVLIQVKSGHVKSGDIRDLRGVVEREEAAIGAFVTLEPPSNDMVTEAVSVGYFTSKTWQKDYPRIQILTVEDLLAGNGIDMPPSSYGTFKQAGKVKKQEGKQPKLISVA
ncbi:MAG: restriction endonuclease [Chloroflexi bacterium]|nr:restriction endonuclease [Chloroflexota bacterium]